MRVVFLLALANAACLRSTAFQCASDAECGTGGRCEATSYCSFEDSSCAGNGDRRYGENSGPQANKCIGEVTPDAMGNEPQSTCPAGYAVLPNAGPRMHQYKMIAAAEWANARDTCAAEMTFLAFPDGANVTDARLEMNALRALAGNGAWVGVSDIANEGTYITSLNQPVSNVLRQLIDLTNNPFGNDCLVLQNATDLEDDDCTDMNVAVCECIP
jgi:hypothetical protein